MFIEKLASAIFNDVVGGLAGRVSTQNLSEEQLEEDIIDERLQVILEYHMKNMLPRNSLLSTLSCIPVDKKSLDRAPDLSTITRPQMHFEMPQIIVDLGIDGVEYIGGIDRNTQFTVYTNTAYQFHQYRKRGSKRPYVYIEPTPNEDNLFDAWIYECPMIDKILITAIFKDPRQMTSFDNNLPYDFDNFSSISNEVKHRVTEKKIRYYRQLGAIATPDTQAVK